MSEGRKPAKSTPGERVAEIIAIAINALPGAGGVLADAANSAINQRRSARLNDFLEKLAFDLNSVKGRIDQELISTEDFENLAETIFVKASENSQKEKLDALRAIFLNTILDDNRNYDESSEIVYLVSGWQPRHLILLKILADPRAADNEMGRVVGEGDNIGTSSISQILGKLLPKWDKDQISRTWEELHQKGILNTRGTSATMTNKGISHLENRLSDFGQKTVDYLQNPVNPDC